MNRVPFPVIAKFLSQKFGGKYRKTPVCEDAGCYYRQFRRRNNLPPPPRHSHIARVRK